MPIPIKSAPSSDQLLKLPTNNKSRLGYKQVNPIQQQQHLNKDENLDLIRQLQSFGLQTIVTSENLSGAQLWQTKVIFEGNIQNNPQKQQKKQGNTFVTKHKIDKILGTIKELINIDKKQLKSFKNYVKEYVYFLGEMMKALIMRLQSKFEGVISFYEEQFRDLQLRDKKARHTQNFQNCHKIDWQQQEHSTIQHKKKLLSQQNKTIFQPFDTQSKEEQIWMKKRYATMLSQFWSEIQRIERDLQKFKVQQTQSINFLSNWQNNLEKQELQIQSIITNLEQREQLLIRKQKALQHQVQFIAHKQYQLKSYQSKNISHGHSIKTSYQQIKPNYSHFNLHRTQKQPSQKLDGIHFNMPMSSSIDLQMKLDSNFCLRQKINHKKLRLMPQKGLKDRNKVNNRLSLIQKNIKKELKEMGYLIG